MIKPVIEVLCNLLTNGDEVDRCYAARTLGKLKDSQAIPTLLKCLRDEDVDVVIDAIEALGYIADPVAIPTLLQSLANDPDGDVKIAVVEALSKINVPATIPPLLELAQTNPEDIIWDETNEWNAWWDMQLLAVKQLGAKKVPAAVPILAAILTDETGQDIENEVLIALAKIGGAGEKILIQRLNTGTPTERRRAATALGLSCSKTTRKALALAMTDKNVEVRVAAIQALGKQDAAPYLDIMLRFLTDPEPEMRQAVIDTVASFATTPEPIIPLLSDPSPIVRTTVLNALANFDTISKEILEQIRPCLADQNNTVVTAAALLLARLKDQNILMLQILSDTRRDGILRSQIATALGILGNLEAVSILKWAIGDQEQAVRLAALNALMQLDMVNSATQEITPLEIIIATLQGKTVTSTIVTEPSENSTLQEPLNTENLVDNDDNPPQSTIESITRTVINKDTTVLLQNPALEDVQEYMTIVQIKLDDSVKPQLDIATDVRYLSANILGNSDRPEAILALTEILTDADLTLRLAAITALGHIAKRSPKIKELTTAIAGLTANLNVEDNNIRLACIRTLGYFDGQDTVLSKYLQDKEPSIRVQTLHSLTFTNIEVNNSYLELLQDIDINVRKAAAAILAKLNYSAAIDAMIDAAFIADGAIARDIGKSLRSLDIEQSGSKLLQKLQEVPNSSYRRFVIEMLEEVFI